MPFELSKTSEVKVWSPFEFYFTIVFSDLTLVRVTDGSIDTSVNEILRAAFSMLHPTTTYGVIDFQTVDIANPTVAKIVAGMMVQLNWPETGQALPGYYLFRKERIIGYHPGTLQLEDTNTALTGAIVGFFGNIFTNDTSWWRAAKYGIEWGPAERMLSFFNMAYNDFMAAEQARENEDIKRQRAQNQQRALKEETDRAYRLLSIRQDASDEDAKNAYRKKMKEWHPDCAHSDEAERIKRTRITAQLNAAYALIKRSRGIK